MKVETDARRVINLFKEAWEKRTGEKWTDSYPFTYQDKWSGVAVLEFGIFVLRNGVKKKIRRNLT